MTRKAGKTRAHSRVRKASVSKKRAVPLRADPPKVRETSRSVRLAAPSPMQDTWDYGIDAWQRSILFLDALRRRANDMLAHEWAGKPPLLDFVLAKLPGGARTVRRQGERLPRRAWQARPLTRIRRHGDGGADDYRVAACAA